MIVNDRIDVALAVGADGVHLGQTDMPIEVARKLLPGNAIIGISCNTPEEVEKAVSAGADYIGIGPVYATSTKKVTNPLLGPRILGEILAALEKTDVKSVAIGRRFRFSVVNACPLRSGGIKSTNAVRTLFGSLTRSGKSLDGLAVVSDIVASREPLAAAQQLKDIITRFKSSRTRFSSLDAYTTELLKRSVGEALRRVRELSPLVHQVRLKTLHDPNYLLMIKKDHERSCDHTISERDHCVGRFAHYGNVPRRNGGPRENSWGFVDQFRDID